jgi:hypothetical protein
MKAISLQSGSNGKADMDRRKFIFTAGAACTHVSRLWGEEPPKDYQRANTDWLAKCGYGVRVHWTAQTVP